jgi:hypothetical protein
MNEVVETNVTANYDMGAVIYGEGVVTNLDFHRYYILSIARNLRRSFD